MDGLLKTPQMHRFVAFACKIWPYILYSFLEFVYLFTFLSSLTMILATHPSPPIQEDMVCTLTVFDLQVNEVDLVMKIANRSTSRFGLSSQIFYN